MKFDLDPRFASLPSAFEHGFRNACLRVSILFLPILFRHCVFNGVCPLFLRTCIGSGFRCSAAMTATGV
jgi:hypothetical protein